MKFDRRLAPIALAALAASPASAQLVVQAPLNKPLNAPLNAPLGVRRETLLKTQIESKPLGPAQSGSLSPLAVMPPQFAEGVSSADVGRDRVTVSTVVRASTPVEIFWAVAEDPQMGHIVANGRLWASERSQWKVNAEVTGLKPGRDYYFQFQALGWTKARSAIGHAKTLP